MFEKLKSDWAVANHKERVRFLFTMVSFFLLGIVGTVSSWAGFYYYKLGYYKLSSQCWSFTVLVITAMYFLSRVKVSPERKK